MKIWIKILIALTTLFVIQESGYSYSYAKNKRGFKAKKKVLPALRLPGSIDQESISGGNRQDYVRILDEACSGLKLSSLDLWKHNLYDAQVQGAVVSIKQGSSLQASDFEKIAKKFADSNFHKGYYWAKCSKDRLLVLSSPSSYPLRKISSKQYELSSMSIKDCSKYSINYAPSESGESKVIRPNLEMDAKEDKNLFLNLDILKKGTLSLSCTNSKNELSLLYLAPVKDGGQDIPLYTFLKSTLADVSSLVVWINNLRRKEGLSSIDFTDKLLVPISQQLIKDKRVEHDLKKLQAIRDYLQKKNLRFLGEDRVKAESFEKMMWLLWNSPTHRSLLLEKKATHGSIAYDHAHSLVSIVLVEHQNTYRVSKLEQRRQNQINKKILQNNN